MLKGTEIASGCVIGAGSILCGKNSAENCIISDVPGEEKKTGIMWDINLREQITEIE